MLRKSAINIWLLSCFYLCESVSKPVFGFKCELGSIFQRLCKSRTLRGYDTTQLAIALNAGNRLAKSGITNFTFISADNALNSAAQAEGLTIDNPNNYP